jgi:hypothetical protein
MATIVLFMQAGGHGFSRTVLSKLFPHLESQVTESVRRFERTSQVLGVQWIKPVLVAEFEFAGWTTDDAKPRSKAPRGQTGR